MTRLLLFLILQSTCFSLFAQYDFARFEGIPVTPILQTKLEECSFTSFFETEDVFQKVEKIDDLLFLKRDEISDKKFDGNFILAIHKLEFNYAGGLTQIYKYYTFEDSVKSKPQIVLFQKNQIYNAENDVTLLNIQTAIKTLNPDAFWAFYSTEPSGIKEIDKIKAQFKDAEGILDIDKLGAYLATKPKELERYCDY